MIYFLIFYFGLVALYGVWITTDGYKEGDTDGKHVQAE